MPSHLLRSIVVFLLLMLGGFPASAQLNPRLWKPLANGPDFLDLYQSKGAPKGTLKPEVVTLLDFSGSMHQIMFDSRFINDLREEASDCLRLLIRVSRTSETDQVSLEQIGFTNSTSPATATLSETFTAGGISLTVGGAPEGSGTSRANILIRPRGDGGYEEVTPGHLANVGASTDFVSPGVTDALDNAYGTGNALNWMRAASHARLRMRGGGVDRIIDIPLNWTVLDDHCGTSNAPLMPAAKIDPKNPARAYAYDTTCFGTSSDYTYWAGYHEMVQERRPSRTWVRSSQALVGGTYASWCGWRPSYLGWIATAKNPDDTFCIPDARTGPGFGNRLFGMSRLQALKRAIIETWLENQDAVLWSIRGLDESEGSSNTLVDPSMAPVDTSADVTTNTVPGGSRDWISLNETGGRGVRRIAKLVASTATPLTSSYANTLVQLMNRDAFKNVPGASPQECMQHFILVATDGAPSSDNNPQELATSFPYLDTEGVGSRVTGNARMRSTSEWSKINIGQAYWNLPTLAALAAHGAKRGATDTLAIAERAKADAPTASGALSGFMPFGVPSRPDKVFAFAHPIQTMTLGMSLGVTLDANGVPLPLQQDTASPRYRMLAAAAVGNPNRASWDLKSTKPFDTNNPQAPNNTFYFDATSPEALVRSLKAAISYAASNSAATTTTMPSFPSVGTGVGNQVYIGQFFPPEDASPVWTGDLSMFATRTTNGDMTIINNDGSPMTGSLSPHLAQWSAGRLFDPANGGYFRPWYSRKLYTRIPKTDAAGTPLSGAGSIVPFSADGADFAAIRYALPTSDPANARLDADDPARKKLIHYLMGADMEFYQAADPTKTPNRVSYETAKGRFTKGILGDIVNSTPVVANYAKVPDLPAGSPLAEACKNDGARFRVIFVGTNHGVLHAFGEASWETSNTVGGGTTKVTQGVVDELWAFIPSDFLPNLHQLYNPDGRFKGDLSPLHVYGFDGTPLLYHLDLPPTGKVQGNGLIDSDEKALLIAGLGKGGRSFYAFDISNPSKPVIDNQKGWVLIPDEAPSGSPTAQMGLATAEPAIGRMITQSGDSKYLTDVLFLGGGHSTGELDTALGTKLGRTVLALDVNTGTLLKSWDLGTTTGPITAGVIPFSVVPNSGLAQRAYFSDLSGNIYALGRNEYSAAYGGFLADTSDLTGWSGTVRKVYINDFPITGENRSTQLPAPFRVSGFPFRTKDPLVSPPTVGIALTMGDRFNPLDMAQSGAAAPSQFRIVVVFDRNDHGLFDASKNGIKSASLSNFTTVPFGDPKISPGSDSYYLSPKTGTPSFGYYLDFLPKNARNLTAKSFAPAIVFHGALAYTYFQPDGSDDVCKLGGGKSYTNRICNVMAPWFPGNGVSAESQTNQVNGCKAGEIWNWIGVASRLAMRSPNTVSQGGKSSSGGDAPTETMTVKSMTGQQSERFAKPRVWRTVFN